MTERDFEQRLRDDFRQMVNEAAPPGLRASVIAIPDLVSPAPERRWTAGWRFPSLGRFAPFALAAAALIVTVLIGIGLGLRLPPTVGPSPIPGSTPEPTASASPRGPLGGGRILVHDAYDPSHPSDPRPLDVFTLDAGSGQRTLLGTVRPSGGRDETGNRYTFQWGADRKHVLLTQFDGGGISALDNPTEAARELIFVCCEPPTEKVPTGGIQARAAGWVLSPQSDRVAGLHSSQAGHEPLSTPDAVVVLDLDGGNIHSLQLPAGTQGLGPISWSPDGSAVVITGCRPCNNEGAGFPAAVEHGHVFIVPVDGSPVRELFDVTQGGFWSAAWSPSGTMIAFGRSECPADEHQPYCPDGTFRLVIMSLADGRQTVVADAVGNDLAWSPDGRRIAFAGGIGGSGIFVVDADGSHLTKLNDGAGREPRWSPDGEWLLFSIYDDAQRVTHPWIVSADGGEPRVLGPYGGYGW